MHEEIEAERVRRGFPPLMTEWHAAQLLGLSQSDIQKMASGDSYDKVEPSLPCIKIGDKWSSERRFTAAGLAQAVDKMERDGPEQHLRTQLADAKRDKDNYAKYWSDEQAKVKAEKQRADTVQGQLDEIKAKLDVLLPKDNAPVAECVESNIPAPAEPLDESAA